jgi:hypothetical protein
MSQPEFWKIKPAQEVVSGSGNQRGKTSRLRKKVWRAVLLSGLFLCLVLFYFFNWGFYRVVESSSNHYSARVYFYSPVEFAMQIGLCVYDGDASMNKVIPLGVVQREGEHGRALDGAYWSKDESSVVVYLWPGDRNPLIGYDFIQHRILYPKEINSVLAQRGGRGREIVGEGSPFWQTSRARRPFEKFPTDIFQGWWREPSPQAEFDK